MNIIIIVVILMTACATTQNKSIVIHSIPIIEINDSIRVKYEVLNDFLDKKIKDHSKKIIIMKEKINTNMTLRILRINDIYSVDSLTSKRIKEDKAFYKEEEWEKARKKYSKNSIAEIEDSNSRGGECCWIAENFNYKNIIFENLHQGTDGFEKKYISSNYDCYYFSKPIYYQDKDYLIFTFFESNIHDALGGSSNIVIYKKINGNWLQTNIGDPDWFN